MSVTYQDIVAAGAASLAEGEFWFIGHPDGDFPELASKDLTAPIRTICDLLEVDWDVLTESGFYLKRGTIAEPGAKS